MPATTVSALIYKVVWDDGDARKKASAWDRKLQDSTKNANLLKKAFTAMSTGLLSFTVDAVKNFAQFEDTLSHARRTMGLSREETLAFGNSLMDLSTSFEEGGLAAGVSANELAKISGILGQLGFNALDNKEQFEKLVVTIAKVGTAFGMSSAKAAEGLGILKNLYDLPVDKIENIASSIAYLGNTTVATSSELLTFMQRVGGIAGLLGVTAQEAAALGATLRESGVTANLAGTAMSQIFSRMASDVERFGEVLKMSDFNKSLLRTKIESGQATDALKMVLSALQKINTTEGKIAAAQALKDLGLTGVRVQQTLLALSNNIGGLNKNLRASEKAFRENKAVNDAYQAAIENTAKKWTQFKNILDVIKKLIGQDLALVFSDFLDNHLIPFADHFKTWLKTSEGAKAIFGKDGLIASGLNWIGEQLSNNEEAFFNWADTLSNAIPKYIVQLKQAFKEEFGEINVTIYDVTQTLEMIEGVFDDVGKAIEQAKIVWEIFMETVRESWNDLKQIGELLGKVIPLATYKSSQGLYGFIEAVKGADKAGQDMGDTWVYHSVLPDIQKELDVATAKLEKFGGSTKELYRTGENTWTNLRREVDDTMTAWELQDGYAMRRQDDLQFNLYETSHAVENLGLVYQHTGEKAVQAAREMQEVTSEAERAAQIFAEANALHTQLGGAQNMTANQWSQLSSGQVRSLWADTNLYTASGITGAIEEQRRKAGEERYAAIQERQSVNITLQLGDTEISHVADALNTHSQAEGRRSFSEVSSNR